MPTQHNENGQTPTEYDFIKHSSQLYTFIILFYYIVLEKRFTNKDVMEELAEQNKEIVTTQKTVCDSLNSIAHVLKESIQKTDDKHQKKNRQSQSDDSGDEDKQKKKKRQYESDNSGHE